MIALVVYACLAADPQSCGQRVVAWSESPAELSCAAQATPGAALSQWQARHPELVVSRRWCLPARVASQPISPAARDPRILPLEACQVSSRAAARIWAARHPGQSAARTCAEASPSN